LQACAEYCRSFSLTALGIVSLPDFDRINFNPEALYGKLLLPGLVEELAEGDEDDPFSDVAPDLEVFAFGGLDYSAMFHDVVADALDFGGQVRRLHEVGFDGIKMAGGKPHFQARTGLRLDGPAYREAFHEAGRLGMPMVIHVADPPGFRHGETGGFNAEPALSYDGPEIPSFDELQRQADEICSLYPETTFIFPHLIFLAGDLPRLRRFMERNANAALDLAPGHYFYGELFRRYDEAREFFESFRDRILFGTDGFWFPTHLSHLPDRTASGNAESTRRLLRFLTSDGEIENPFEPTRAELPQLYGLRLPEPVLDAVFHASFAALVGEHARPINPAALDDYMAEFTERLSAIGGQGDDIEAVRHIRRACAEGLRDASPTTRQGPDRLQRSGYPQRAEPSSSPAQGKTERGLGSSSQARESKDRKSKDRESKKRRRWWRRS
jgi:hypothetical protein